MQNKKGFTLVELIVVIVVLSILGTIGFISLSGFSSNARDSKRISDLANIRSGLDVYASYNYVLPIPENSVTVGSGTTDYTIQGYAGEDILNSIKVSLDAIDPLDDEYYTYSITPNRKKLQLMAYLENDMNATQVSSLNIIPNTYADYSDRFPYSVGETVGVFVDPLSRIPIHKIGINIDLSTDNNDYTAIFKNRTDAITSSGSNIVNEIIANNPVSGAVSLIGNSGGGTGSGGDGSGGEQTPSEPETPPEEETPPEPETPPEEEICEDPVNVTSPTLFTFDSGTQTITGYNSMAGGSNIIIPCQINGLDVLNIGNYSFDSIGLDSVVLPNTIDSIGSFAFEDNRLQEIVIPEGVKTIGNNAFSSNELSTITIPESITSLGNYVFTNQVFVYNGIINGPSTGYAFETFLSNSGSTFDKSTHPRYEGLSGIVNNNLNCTNPLNVTSPGYFGFNTTTQTITGYNVMVGGEALVIPCQINGQDVLSIGDSAFWNLGLDSVVLPNTINSIGNFAFEDNRLQEIVIPEGVETIGNNAFSSNELSGITIPESVTNLGNYVFNNQVFVYDGTIYGPSTGYIFETFLSNSGSTFDKTTHPKYEGFSGIVNNNSNCTNPGNVTSPGYFGFNTTTQTITGYNVMVGGEALVIPCQINGQDVLNIGDYSLASMQLNSVMLPNTVDNIGIFSFEDNRLQEIVIPEGVKTIGNNAFSSNEISTITLPSTISSIGDYAFIGQVFVYNGTVYGPGSGHYVYNAYLTNDGWIFDKDIHSYTTQ